MLFFTFPCFAQAFNSKHIQKYDLTLMTFNVQNLFDGIDDSQEYEDYRPPKWTEKDYQQRMMHIAKALQSLEIIPDIIAFEEVEKQEIVQDIQQYYFPRHKYIASTNNPLSATENVVLSKYKIVEAYTHSLNGSLAKGTRHLLDLRIDIPQKFTGSYKKDIRIQVIVVHLKSKRVSSSKKYSSDSIRALQYKLISKVLDDDIPAIILGDFNDINPLFHLSPHSLFLAELESVHKDITGTYNYRGKWERIDHIIINNVLKAKLGDIHLRVIDIPPFINDKLLPYRFIRRLKNFNAVSDHLPLLFYAKFLAK